MPPRSLLQSSSSVLHLPGCWLFPLPLSLLFLSFRSLFFLSSSLLLTSVWSHHLSLPFVFPPVASTSLISCPLVPPSFSTVTFSPVTFLHVMFPVVLSPFVVLAITLPPLSIPFTISVSLANSAVRQSTFQHPKHWNVNPSSVVSDQVFPHPDTAKSTKLWQWLHTKCLLAFTCRLPVAILRFVKINS